MRVNAEAASMECLSYAEVHAVVPMAHGFYDVVFYPCPIGIGEMFRDSVAVAPVITPEAIDVGATWGDCWDAGCP